MYAVCVTFRTHPHHHRAFVDLVTGQADASLGREPDCHRFDICEDPAGGEVFLYELYTDQAAFAAHLQSAHFAAFDRACAGLIRDKSVRTFEHVREGGAAP